LTREQSINTEPIIWDDHLAWIQRNLSNPSRQIYIFEEDGKPVGTCRIDKEKKDGQDIYELSWTVAPPSRGKGVGKRMLSSLLENSVLQGQKKKAVIKEGNLASEKMVLHFGFVKRFEADGLSVWFKD